MEICTMENFEHAWSQYQTGNPEPLTTNLWDIPFERYLKVPALSSHGIMDLLRSPAHYYVKARLGHTKETEAFARGRVLHKAILEPTEARRRFMVEPKFVGKTKDGRDSEQSAEAKAMREEWYANLPKDAIVVEQERVDVITGMIEALQHHKVAWNLVSKGHSEVSGFWLTETGVLCKWRPDKLHFVENVIADYKSTQNAQQRKFELDVARYDYDIQAYWYKLSYFKMFGIDPTFVFIPQEHESPYALNVFPVSDAILEIGKHYVDKALLVYEECCQRETDLMQSPHYHWRMAWPSYEQAAVNINPVHWRMMEVQDEFTG